MPKTTPKVNIKTTQLSINGLKGRMMSARRADGIIGRNILLLYGQHSSLERMRAFVEVLGEHGAVTMPDLPGFGGMQSLYSIGDEPTIDAMADYLAAFVKMRYKHKRLTIVGMSYGFLVATRMLQKYPELRNKVDMVVSVAGFVHHQDFVYSSRKKRWLARAAKPLTTRSLSWFAQNFLLRGPFIHFAYWLVKDKHAKMRDAGGGERRERVKFEIKLWKQNDIRTQMRTSISMLKVDLCKTRIEGVDVHHVAISADHFFDNYSVEQHLNVVYDKVKVFKVDLDVHMPTVIASREEVLPFIPKKLHKVLSVS